MRIRSNRGLSLAAPDSSPLKEDPMTDRVRRACVAAIVAGCALLCAQPSHAAEPPTIKLKLGVQQDDLERLRDTGRHTAAAKAPSHPQAAARPASRGQAPAL